jgi:hypothetical protein
MTINEIVDAITDYAESSAVGCGLDGCDCLEAELDRLRAAIESYRSALAEENDRLRAALQPFANLRVDESASTEGPDREVTVGIVKRKGMAKTIALGVYENVIPTRWVYAARRAMSSKG